MNAWTMAHPVRLFIVIMCAILVVGTLYAQWESRNDNHPS